MSESAILWLFGILIAALGVLIVALAKILWAKLTTIEAKLGEIDSGALATFIARFNATERSWEKWRDDLEKDRSIRHDEYRSRLDAHAIDIKSHESRITRIERNGHQ